MVVDYIENEGIEVQDFLALEIPDNLEVASQDPTAPSELWRNLNLTEIAPGGGALLADGVPASQPMLA